MRLIFIYTILSSLCLLTCSKEKSYDFQVINRTYYDIIEFDLDWCQSDYQISIGPGQTSEIHTLEYKTSAANAFGTGELCIGVKLYSNSPGAVVEYSHNCGIARGRKFFSEEKLNKIFIDEDVDEEIECQDEDNRFKFEYE